MEILEFISRIGKLKDLERTGWKIFSVIQPESVSDHSFRVALLAMFYGKKLNLDVEKCLKLALIHDIEEVYTGDIATRLDKKDQKISNKEKRILEKNSLMKIVTFLPEPDRTEVINLWTEYEENKTKESQLVNDLDKIEMILQALEYIRNKRTNKDLEEFFQTSKLRIKTKTGKKLWKEIRREHLKVKRTYKL